MLGFETAPHERVPAGAALDAPSSSRSRAGCDEQGDDAWAAIAAEYDQYGVREFLELREWSEGAIEMFGLLFNQEALMNSSFLELLREELGGYYTDLVYLDGGTDQLPRAFLPELAPRIRFGAKVVAIEQSDDAASPCTAATRAGASRSTADYAVLTAPFPVLRHVEVLTPFSRLKQRAIRQLHYDASAKVFLQFRRRFWEDDDGIIGGGTVTDLAVRNVYYPDHGRDDRPRRDARQLHVGRGRAALGLALAGGPHRAGARGRRPASTRRRPTSSRSARRRCGTTTSSRAARSRCSIPASRRCSTRRSCAPEGRIHFAGEHASLAHAWIQGAIESGLRAAAEIHEQRASATLDVALDRRRTCAQPRA